MGRKTSVEDFENDGFTVYTEKDDSKKYEVKVEAPKVAPTVAPKTPSKIIIMDNKDVLVAVKESNEVLKNGLEQMVRSMDSKPKSFTLDIKRDQQGFMTSINVKVN
jgi:hypothetical protein